MFPRGNPLGKLLIIFFTNQIAFSSSTFLLIKSIKILRLIESKYFLTSHFKIKHGFVLFLLAFLAKSFNLFTAPCVPLPTLQEYESKIKDLSKTGYSMRKRAWCKTLSLTQAL